MASNNIFEQLAIFRTTNELNSGILNKNKRVSISGDPFTVLVDLLKVLIGESGIEKGINGILKSVKTYQTSFKGFVKHEINDVLGGSNNRLPIEGTFTINLLKLSPSRLLMTKDEKRIARMSNFDKKLNKAIRTNNVKVNINKVMDVSYNNNNGDFTFHFTGTNKIHIDILNDLVDEIEIVELTNIYYDVLDSMFNFSNKDKKDLEEEAKINLIFGKMISQEDIDDSYYKFTDDDVKYIEETINIRTEHFYGIPSEDGSLTEDQFNNLINGNRNMLGASFLTALSEIVTQNVFLTNRATAKKNFLGRFIEAFKNTILKKYLLSTEIIVIYNILYKKSYSASEFIKFEKNFFKCIYKQLLNLILLTLFALVKKEIMKLVTSMSISYSKEILKKYKNILSSLF